MDEPKVEIASGIAGLKQHPRMVLFTPGQTININGALFRIRKVTPKDIVLRPIKPGTLYR